MSHLSTSLKRCSFWKVAFDGTQHGLLWSVTAHLSTKIELGKVMWQEIWFISKSMYYD